LYPADTGSVLSEYSIATGTSIHGFYIPLITSFSASLFTCWKGV